MHPVTKQIDAAIDVMERNVQPVTPASVKVNVKKALTWADWSPEDAADEALDPRIARRLKARGYVIADPASDERPQGIRKDFWTCSPDELEEQTRIKRRSSEFDQNRIACDEAIIAFLREQQKSFGYEVYPGLFHAEIDRIYAMHSLSAPGASVSA